MREMEENTTAATIAALQQQIDELERRDKIRSQFIWVVTHELRAPVAAIQSYLKLILEGYVPPEKQREIIAKAERRSVEQLELIGDLLELARLQEGRIKYKIENVNVAAMLTEISDMMSAYASEKGLSFNAYIAPGSFCVEATMQHIKQLWTNLISNAIKYNKPGGTVEASLRQEGDKLIGIVRDTGIGIAPESMSKVFSEFYRATNAKEIEKHGTGLGLSIVKQITETYGGTIILESELGQGSTFTFTLPAVECAVHQEE